MPPEEEEDETDFVMLEIVCLLFHKIWNRRDLILLDLLSL
jgi:hypothetical protein